MSDKELDAIADAMEALAKRLEKLEGTSSESLAKERRASERERRLLRQEREYSERAMADHARLTSEMANTADDNLRQMKEMISNRQRNDLSRATLMNDKFAEVEENMKTLLQMAGDIEANYKHLKKDASRASEELQFATDQARKPFEQTALQYAEQARSKVDQAALNEAVQRELRVLMEGGFIQPTQPQTTPEGSEN